MSITKTERNRVFTAIKDAGLDPRTCKLSKSNTRNLTVEHPATGSHFKIYQRRWIDKNRLFVQPYVPVLLTAPKVAVIDESYYNWDDLLIALSNWARLVLQLEDRTRQLEEQRRAQEAVPDLWTFPSDWDMPESQDVENTPFTTQEHDEISEQLREIKEYVKRNYELTEMQFARIEERLDEAEEASHRMGRKDWLLLFGGVVLTLIVTDLVPPAVVEQIFTGIVHGLGHLFGSGPRRSIIET